MKFLFQVIGVLLGAGSLAGCYETDFAVVERGEKVAISGTYQCTNRLSGEKKLLTFAEKREGIWPIANYEYIDNEGDSNLFKKNSSGLFIGQSKNRNGRFGYAFIDFTDDKSFLILSADLVNKADYIEPMLKKFGIQTKQVGQKLLLNGDKSKVAAFLAAHDKALLTVVVKCEHSESVQSKLPPPKDTLIGSAASIGNLRATNHFSGCGCSANPILPTGQIDNKRTLFISDFESNAWINIDGRDTVFRSTEKLDMPSRYSSGSYTLTVSSKARKQQSCKRGSGECEVTDMDFVFKLSTASQTKTFKGVGSCGC